MRYSNRLINLLICASLLMLTTSYLFAYKEIEMMINASDWVLHSHEVIEKSFTVEIDLIRGRAAAKSFLLSNDVNKLDGVEITMIAALANLQDEIILTKDNPEQNRRVLKIKPKLDERVAAILQFKKNIQSGSHASAIADYDYLRSEEKYNDIISELNGLRDTESNLLKLRKLNLAARASYSNLMLLICGILGDILLIVCFVILNYQAKKQHQAEQAKLVSDYRLKNIIDSSQDLIAAIDTNFQFIDFNRSFEQIFAPFFEKKLQANVKFDDINHELPFYPEMKKSWERALAGASETTTHFFELSNLSMVFFEATYNCMRDNKKNIIGATQILRDITERKKIEQVKSEFISVVSHELRTPLTSIRGSLGLLLGGVMGALDVKIISMLKIANSNCERLVHLINDILDIEKIESGKLEFQFSVVNLNKLLSEAILENEGYAQRFEVDVQFIPSAKNIYVRGDYYRLMQVVSNLISNAVKFSPKDGLVTIRVAKQFDQARVSIIDRGEGIPHEFRAHIFEKFSQADPSAVRKRGGSGLGLSISKAIIDKMNGSINFVTDVKNGTTFYFDLPLVAGAEDESEENQANATPALMREKKKILYIEDDKDLSLVITKLLEKEFSVVHVETKTAAMAKKTSEMFDLILLDLVLPDGSGIDLLPQLNAAKTPILVFSAYDLPPAFVNQVTKTLIKSRTTNDELIKAIKEILAT